MKLHTATYLLLAAPATLAAQELNESMTVQGAYDPVIRSHERISSLPSRLELPLPEATLPMAEKGVSVDVPAQVLPLTATDYGTSLPKSFRGYLDLHAGSYLNTSVAAGYRAIARPATTLDLRLQHNSSSLFRANNISPYRRRYDERIGAALAHTMQGGMLRLAADYHLGYFNYYRAMQAPLPETVQSDENIPGSQTINDFNALAEWIGSRRDAGFNYAIALDYRHFGYRRTYTIDNHTYPSVKGPKENDMHLTADLGYRLGDTHVFSLALGARIIDYSHTAVSTPGFYTITPGYTFTSGPLRMRLGARLDLSSSITGTTDFATFHAAPDVNLLFTASRFTASLSANGGVQPLTLAGLHQLAYYSIPAVTSTTPMFTPVNVTLRLGFGDFHGLSASVFASYAISRNTPLEGTYPLHLFDSHLNEVAIPLSFIDIHGFSMGTDFSFSIAGLVDGRASLTYTPQHGSRGSFNGIDRPRWTITSLVTVKPIKPLAISVGYDYRGVRNLYYRHNLASQLSTLRLPDLYDLHARVDYTFLQRYTVGLAADNILGSNPYTCPQMPLEGFTLSGRLAVLF